MGLRPTLLLLSAASLSTQIGTNVNGFASIVGVPCRCSTGRLAGTAASTTMSTARTTSLFMSETWDGAAPGGGSGAGGAIEQIEFKIHPDGRVEETVRGVKGNNCHKVTEKINEKLGEVVASSPTEEMFEQEVVVNEQIYLSESNNDGGGGGSWEGSSSW